MTVTSTSLEKDSHSGDGSQHSFPYTFLIYQDADIKVTIRAADGTETVKTLNTHFIVTNANVATGGNVLFKYNTGTSSDAHYSTSDYRPQSGETVVLSRNLSINQGTNYIENDTFGAETHETAIDRLTYIAQDLQDQVSRSLKVNFTNAITSSELKESSSDRANKMLAFDSSGNLQVTSSLTNLLVGTSIVFEGATADAYETTLTVTDPTGSDKTITLPNATGTVSLTSNTETLTNKTLTTPVIAQISNSGTLTLPTSSDTLVGRATTDTLTNKTLTTPVISSISNSGTLTLPTDSDTLVGRATTDTLTNKTLTTPIIAEIDSGSSITLDATTDIYLNADGGDIFFQDGAATFGSATNSSGNLIIKSGTTTALTFSGADVTAGGDLTVTGDLTVNGDTTTVNTATLSVEDPLIILAKANNSSDSLDIGFYGLYDTSGSQDLYAGLFRDANDSGKWKLFKDLQAAPDTTVNTSGTGYAVGTLVANLEGDVTGTLQTAAQTNITSVGDLDAGSITSGFGAIDNGASGIRTNTFTAEDSILPSAVGGADLGSTSAEWGDIYIADDKKIYFGSGQDVSLEYDEDGIDTLLISGGDVTLADDKKLYFGSGKDISLEYDEDGTDTLLISGAAVNFGVDDTGIDVKFFGATSGKYMEWDESADQLNVSGTLSVGDNTDVTTILGRAKIASPASDIAYFSHYDFMDTDSYSLAQTSAGLTAINAHTGQPINLNINNTTVAQVTSTGVGVTGTLTVGVDGTGHDVIFYGADSGSYMQWDENVDELVLHDTAQLKWKNGSGSSALNIYHHTDNNTYLTNSIGSFNIFQSADDESVRIYGDDESGGHALYFQANGATGETKLYHYGNEKISTKSTGIEVTGDLTITSTDAGSGDDPSLILKRDSSSPADWDNLGNIDFIGENDASEAITYASISGMSDDVSDGTEDGRIRFSTHKNGTHTDIIDISQSGMVFRNEGNILWYLQNGSYNTTLAGGTPTADRTITLPDATGTVLVQDSNDDVIITSTDAGATDDPSLILYRNSSSPADNDDLGEILFKGRNDNSQDVEYAKIWADAADVSDGAEDGKLKFVVMKDGTATNMLDLKGSGKTTFNNNDVQLATGVNLLFEGATNDANETTLTVTDPTQNNTITLPDATGTVLVKNSSDDVYITSTDAGSSVDPTLIFYRNSSSPADYDQIGQVLFRGRNDNSQDVEYGRIYVQPYDVSDGSEDSRMHFATMYGGTETIFMSTGWGYVYFYSNLYLNTGKTIMFEGATGNDFETTLTVDDPTADRTITLPDATGTVALATPNILAGTLLATTTVSDDATVDFNSTYVTSTYDHYDLLITGLIPATDNTFLGLRFGTANSADSTSTKYAYVCYFIGASDSDGYQINYNYDNQSSAIVLTPTTNFSMGTGTGEGLSMHLRCWDLSSTSLYKKASPMGAGTMGAGAYFGQSYATVGGYKEASAVNFISLYSSSGNLASGTVSLYGIKKG